MKVPPSLKVCLVAGHDSSGGAAQAAYRLHRGLVSAGVQSTMLVRDKATGDPTVETFRAATDFRFRLLRRIHRRQRERKYRPFLDALYRGNDCLLNPAGSEYPGLPGQLPPDAIINLHWVAGCIDVPTFFKTGGPSRRYVWTMHDMWPMTGACHYSSGCTRYAGKCGACHQILSADPLDVTHLEWIEKSIGYTALRDDQLVVVTPSVWLAQEARRSSLLGRFDVRVIPNGIDLTAFTPCDRQLAREALGLPREAFVIAFVADNVTTPRKGFQVLTAALERLPDRADTWLISVGNGSPTVPEGYRSAHFGRVQKDRIMSLFYSAADVFVAPTLEDNLPTTVLESLACGTPVIGSDVGGVPDMVRPGQTGFLFAAGSAGALAELLAPLRQREALAGLRPRCREVAEREYSVTLQAHRYEDLYRHLQPQ